MACRVGVGLTVRELLSSCQWGWIVGNAVMRKATPLAPLEIRSIHIASRSFIVMGDTYAWPCIS